MFEGPLETTVIYGFLTVFSGGLLIISILSYQKSQNKKILFISVVFLFFLIKGVLLSASIFIPQFQDYLSIPIMAFIDLLILLLLFFAVLKT